MSTHRRHEATSRKQPPRPRQGPNGLLCPAVDGPQGLYVRLVVLEGDDAALTPDPQALNDGVGRLHPSYERFLCEEMRWTWRMGVVESTVQKAGGVAGLSPFCGRGEVIGKSLISPPMTRAINVPKEGNLGTRLLLLLMSGNGWSVGERFSGCSGRPPVRLENTLLRASDLPSWPFLLKTADSQRLAMIHVGISHR